MKIIVDARSLTLYPVGKPTAFTGATEMVVRVLASGLAAHGHTVHVVTPDLDEEEQRGPNEWWWGPSAHPTKADVLIPVPHVVGIEEFTFDALVPFNNGPDYVGDERCVPMVSAWPVFSQCHGKLLCAGHPGIDAAKCVVTGLGVDLKGYDGPLMDAEWKVNKKGERRLHIYRLASAPKIPGRIWVGNDPARGLWHVLDAFEIIQQAMPEASLHVSYDFAQRFERTKWQHRAIAEMLWECDRRLRTMPNVVNLGALTRPEVVREQLEAMVHLWPSDPPNVGTQIHGISQMEAAAAGCALVLSDIEAFPEVFGEAATILPTVGKYDAVVERRCDAQDYADATLELLRDPAKWADASRKSRALAECNDWSVVIERWDALLRMLVGEQEKAA